jgi:hypothetical protein
MKDDWRILWALFCSAPWPARLILLIMALIVVGANAFVLWRLTR